MPDSESASPIEALSTKCVESCVSAGDKLERIFNDFPELESGDIRIMYDTTERIPVDGQLGYEVAFSVVYSSAVGNDENSRRIIVSEMGRNYFPSIAEQVARLDRFLDKTPEQMINGALGVVRSDMQDHLRDHDTRPELDVKLLKLEALQEKIMQMSAKIN